MGACCGSKIDEMAVQYIRELTVILRTRNLQNVKIFYGKWAEQMEMDPIPDDHQLEIDMHKMICELPALEDLHAESLEFLKARGQAWDIRDNGCSHDCDPAACGRRE